MSARMRPVSQVELEQQLQMSRDILSQAMTFDEQEQYSKALAIYKKGLNITIRAIGIRNIPPHLKPIHSKLKEYNQMYKERIQVLENSKDLQNGTWGNMISSTFGKWFNGSQSQPEPPQRRVHQQPRSQCVSYQSITPGKSTTVKRPTTQEKLLFHERPKKERAPKRMPSATKKSPKDKMQQLKDSPHVRGLDKELVANILNDVVVDDTRITFDDIAGLNNVKQLLMEVIVWPAQRPDLFQGLLKPPRGVLLFGPPGTGKTMIAQAVAGQCDATFFSISASSLSSKWHGENEKLVRTLFSLARGLAPSIIFIDEIDSLLSKRSDKEHEASRRMKTEFFVQMQGIQQTEGQKDSVLVIGATNLPSDLDSAALRRFERRVMVPLPDVEARQGLIHHLLKKVKCGLSPSDFQVVVQSTLGYSCADLTQLCTEAAFFPLRDTKRPLIEVSQKDIRPVNLKDFERAMHIVKPSTNKNDIAELEQWNQDYGSTATNE